MQNCFHCKYLIIDKIGDGHGIAKCRPLEEYKKSNPSKTALKKALMKIGNNSGIDFIWPGYRNCQKFEEKTNVVEFKR